MSYGTFLIHGRTAHYLLVFVSFSLMATAFVNVKSISSIARSQLREIIGVGRELGPEDFDRWATERATPIAVTFERESGEDSSFHVARDAIVIEADRLMTHKDDSNLPPSCADVARDAEGRSMAAIVFENNNLTHALKVRGPKSILKGAHDPDVRFVLKTPGNLRTVKGLWSALGDGVVVRRFEPYELGFVANVIKGQAERPTIDYSHPVAVMKEVEDDTGDHPELCLIAVRMEHFVDGPPPGDWPAFGYAYVRWEGAEFSEGGGEFEYKLFVVPAIPQVVEEHNQRIEGARVILRSACEKWHRNNFGTFGAGDRCFVWANESFGIAFPELEEAVENVVEAADFEVISHLLQFRTETESEGEFTLPGGASIPMSNRGLVVIAVAVVVMQVYLLLAMVMALTVAPGFTGGPPFAMVPWLALFETGVPAATWRVSLLVPSVSVLISGVSIVGPVVSSEQFWENIGRNAFPATAHGVLFGASLVLMWLTWRTTPKVTKTVVPGGEAIWVV